MADPDNWGAVTIVSTDMRVWAEKSGGKKCDILVSELLGSFGDNELSPECLGAAHSFPPVLVAAPRVFVHCTEVAAVAAASGTRQAAAARQARGRGERGVGPSLTR